MIRYQTDGFESERVPLNNNDFEEPNNSSLIQKLINSKGLQAPTTSTSKLVSILTTICCKIVYFIFAKEKYLKELYNQ